MPSHDSPNDFEMDEASNELIEATGSFVLQLEETDTQELPTRDSFYTGLQEFLGKPTESVSGVSVAVDSELRQMFNLVEIPRPDGGEPLIILPHQRPSDRDIAQTSVAFGYGPEPERPYDLNLVKLALAVSLLQPSTKEEMVKAENRFKQTGVQPNLGEIVRAQKQLAARLTDRTDILALLELYRQMQGLLKENQLDEVTRMSIGIRQELMRNIGENATATQSNEARLMRPF